MDAKNSVFLTLLLCLCGFAKGQNSRVQNIPDSTWIGQRVIMLKGRGEVNSSDASGATYVVQAQNIVAPVSRIEGNKVWILRPGELESTAWVDKNDILLLTDAIQYFTFSIEKEPTAFDAYFRRAEAEHALNKRDEAISDYTKAIELNPGDPYLYFRRARSYHARQMCNQAIADYDEVIKINPGDAMVADAYSRQASLYANCSDTLQRNPQKAIETARKAINLDSSHPNYLTILASAYERNGQLDLAIITLKKALNSPNLPPGPGYRPNILKYLQRLEEAFAEKRK